MQADLIYMSVLQAFKVFSTTYTTLKQRLYNDVKYVH